jgi:DNA-directed RNA polymerase subunit N (RpoN/RPB10)
MIYLKCPTCATVLGNREIEYEKGLEKIMNDNNTNDEKKRELKSKLLNSLLLKNPCCKMRIMSYIQLTEIII